MINIDNYLDRVRDFSQVDIKSAWRVKIIAGDIDDGLTADIYNWQIPEYNERGYLIWPRGRQVIWLGYQLIIPSDRSGYSLVDRICRLHLIWWAEDVRVFINGQLVQAGDLFDANVRVLLTESTVLGDVFDLRVRLVSPLHDGGGLMKSTVIYESIDPHVPEPSFIADELAIISKQVECYYPDRVPKLEEILARSTEKLSSLEPQLLFVHLDDLKQQLFALLPADRTQGIISLLGHAHLDLAWLWEVDETWAVAERTFDSALNLQAEYPHLTFCHSTPVLYEHLQATRPELFDRLRRQVDRGNWEIVGGMWVEPDLNLISVESIARQIIYGQVYNQQQFGRITKVAWLPDTFGFCWQLPQLLQLGGIDYFVTQKLQWNDTTKFPHHLFWWQSPDGSRVLSLMSSPIGEGIDPLKVIDYHYAFARDTKIDNSLWLFGVGDHGGGPTRDMLELADRWSKSSVIPEIEFTTAIDYLDRLSNAKLTTDLPVWQDELYLEFHRGCFTTHAGQKRSNRQCEDLLYQAELWSSLAAIINESSIDDAVISDLETAWKYTLFNQFHDIIPGTAITPVYERANREWEMVESIATQIVDRGISQLIEKITIPTPPIADAIPIVIFNAIARSRTQIVRLVLPDNNLDRVIYDLDGNEISSQITATDIAFIATNIPSVGYKLYWLCPYQIDRPAPIYPEEYILKNQYLKVTIDRTNGTISSLIDRTLDRELCPPTGTNRLLAFTDANQYWDAWNIDPAYAKHPLPAAKLISISWQECGDVTQKIRTVIELAECQFTQDYILDTDSPQLVVETSVNWQAEHVLIQADFPLNLHASKISYEMAGGTIDRPTNPTTPADRAKWEVPALKWADISDDRGDFGVSIITDTKHGWSGSPQHLRLSLLRAPTWPDPTADRGYHQFSYTIYPHRGNWQSAATVARASQFNSPLQIYQLAHNQPRTGKLAPIASLLDLGTEDLVLTALKPALAGDDTWVIRCYECHGNPTKINLSLPTQINSIESVNLLEETRTGDPRTVLPWQIASWRVNL